MHTKKRTGLHKGDGDIELLSKGIKSATQRQRTKFNDRKEIIEVGMASKPRDYKR